MNIYDTLRDPVLAVRYGYYHGKSVYPLNIFLTYIFIRPLKKIGISADTTR